MVRGAAWMLAAGTSLFAAAPAHAIPQITGARLAAPATTAGPAALVVSAVDPAAPISGFGMQLPDGGRVGASACRPADSTGAAPGKPFRAGDAVRFVLRPRFATEGAATVDVRVVSGDCGAPAAAVSQPFTLTVAAPGAPLVPLIPGVPSLTTGDDALLPWLPPATTSLPVPIARAAASKRCKGVDEIPTVATLARARRATLCLINRERAKNGRAAVHSDKLLKRAAKPYAVAMVVKDFFAHAEPGGMDFGERVAAAGWPGVKGTWHLGENIGFGTGVLATPKMMVRAWMDSTGHRANLLDRGFSRVGIAIAFGTPGDSSQGATYVTDYGAVGR